MTVELAFVPCDQQAMDPLAVLMTVPGTFTEADVGDMLRHAVVSMRDADTAQKTATTLRSVANDLDAFAHRWRLEMRARSAFEVRL